MVAGIAPCRKLSCYFHKDISSALKCEGSRGGGGSMIIPIASCFSNEGNAAHLSALECLITSVASVLVNLLSHRTAFSFPGLQAEP